MLLADYAIQDAITGKHSLMGIFQQFHFPADAPKIVANFVIFFLVENSRGVKYVNIKIKNTPVDFDLGSDNPTPTDNLTVVGVIQGLEITSPGKYPIVVSVGDEIISDGEHEIEVVSITREQ